MGEPVAACGWQVLVDVSQYCFATQSPSTLHPVDGRHVPFVEQAPLWHAPGVAGVHVPSPFAYPHSLFFVSQTPLIHTATAPAGVHVPSSVGTWPGTFGIGVLFASCAMHVPASHHCPRAQLASTRHALPQAPLGSQTLPACTAPPAVQVVVPPAVPQTPHAPPPPGQYGADTGQSAVPIVPLSPLQATQVSRTESQIGVPPEQFVASVAVHWAHTPVPRLPEGSQTLLRQTPDGPPAFVVEQGPEPFGSPQTLSAPQTPLRQRSEDPTRQTPLPGIGSPVAPWAWQVLLVVSQYCIAAQSLSTLQPVDGRQSPFVEHAPLTHTLGSPTVHGPSPLA